MRRFALLVAGLSVADRPRGESGLSANVTARRETSARNTGVNILTPK